MIDRSDETHASDVTDAGDVTDLRTVAGASELTEEQRLGISAALDAGEEAVGRARPNPAVGCALVREGRVIATGFLVLKYEGYVEDETVYIGCRRIM